MDDESLNLNIERSYMNESRMNFHYFDQFYFDFIQIRDEMAEIELFIAS